MHIAFKTNIMARGEELWEHLLWLNVNVSEENFTTHTVGRCDFTSMNGSPFREERIDAEWEKLHNELTAFYEKPEDSYITRIERHTGDGWALYYLNVVFPMLFASSMEHWFVVKIDDDELAVLFKLARVCT